MRILFAIKTLVHSIGGGERLAAELSNDFARRGMESHILTFDRPDETPFYPLDPLVKRHSVTTLSPARKTGLLEYPLLLWRLRQAVLAVNPDIVMAFMHSMFVPLQCALLGTGIRVVLSEHTVPVYYTKRPLELIALRFFSLFAHSATIVSAPVRALYPPEMAEKMVILPNPVYSDFSRADAAAGERKVILSVGRLNADKDHAILIQAFAKLASEFPEWDLMIVGEGPIRPDLEKMIADTSLEKRISLPGTRTDINSVYRSAQIYAMPSKYESFGLATAEAMSHALPVVGFADCSGTNEIIDHEKSGLLVQKRTPEDLAQNLRILMLSAELRLQYGEYGYHLAEAYRPEKVIALWENYVKSL